MRYCWLAALLISSSAAEGPPPADQDSAAVEQHIPSWLKFSGEIRGRMESLDGINYVPHFQDSYYLHRIRLNAGIRVSSHFRAVIQLQDSQAPGYRRKPVPATVANTLDLRQSYLEAGSEEGVGWVARVGRQPLVFGDMRLVSTSNWGNVGPAYDGGRISYQTRGVRLDWFATSLVLPVAGHFDRPRGDRRLHGFYSTFNRGLHNSTVEAYFFWKDNLLGDLDVYTIGTHAFGKLPGAFDYNVETALQTGHIARSGLRAWAGHWEMGHATGESPWYPRLIAEYNYASGDGNPTDGRVRTFDNLYPTDKWGTADGIAWRNIHEAIFSTEWRPVRKWRIRTSYHAFWLASRKDALYSIGGAVLAHNPAAKSGRVGSELDLRTIYQHNVHLQLSGGYGYFLPGPYMKQCTPGSGIQTPYLMWVYAF
jgi:hypothetical protein